jgi:O-antigen/teichoic acid export membrane protein
MSLLNKFIKRTSWELAGNIISKIAWFGAMVLIIRSLPVSQYGLYVIAMAYGLLVARVSSAGINVVATREIARVDYRLELSFIGNLLFVRALLSLAVIALYASGIFLFLDDNYKIFVLILALFAGVLQLYQETWRAIFRGFEKFRYSLILSTSQAIILFIGCIVGAVFHLKLIYFLLLLVVSYAISNIVGLCLLRLRLDKLSFKINWQVIKDLLKKSWPIGVSSIMMVGYTRIIMILFDVVGTPQQAGLFGVPFNLSRNLIIISGAFCGVSLPVFSQKGIEKGGCDYRFLVKFLIAVGLPIAIVTSFFSEQILTSIYGPVYGGSSLFLIILVWAMFLFFLSHSLKTYLEAINLQYYWTFVMGMGVIFVTGIGYFAIKYYGALGASYALLFVELFIVLMGLCVACLKADIADVKNWIPVVKTLFKILILSSSLAIIIFFFKSYSFYIVIPIAFIFYFFGVIKLGVFKRGEIQDSNRIEPDEKS